MGDEIYVPPKPAGWVPPPRHVPMNEGPVYNIGQPQYALYPATGPPPPDQVIHTQNPSAVYQESCPQQQGPHTVVVVDGLSQQQRQIQDRDKRQCCMMTICALCLCCILD